VDDDSVFELTAEDIIGSNNIIDNNATQNKLENKAPKPIE
jgi:hypothetical protein